MLYPSTFFDQTCHIGLDRASNYINTKDNSTSGIWFLATLFVLGDCPGHPRARGLSRLFLCSGTVQATIVLENCPDHHRARGLFRPLSCSGTTPTTLRPLLGDHSPRLHVICTHIQLRGIYFFSLRPCYKADPRLPASSGTTSV